MTSQLRSTPTPTDPLVGTELNGKWTLERLLGEGGTSKVYLARHRNRKRAAIKVLLEEFAKQPSIVQLFLHEAYIANTVDHPGSVRVDDDGMTADGRPYLIMELLEGESVQTRWERAQHRLSLGEVVAIADQLLAVLEVAHRAGVVHRDLKPDNLFVTPAGTLKVLDFGIASLHEPSASVDPASPCGIMGTPAFMPPEQAMGRWEEVDARTDLWAVGAIVFTLLIGRNVHVAATELEILLLAQSERPAPVAQIEPSLASALAEWIDRALAIEPQGRFPDASSMREALHAAYRHATAGESVPALVSSWEEDPQPVSRVQRVSVPRIMTANRWLDGARRHLTVALIAAALFVLLAWVTRLRPWQSPRPNSSSLAPSVVTITEASTGVAPSTSQSRPATSQDPRGSGGIAVVPVEQLAKEPKPKRPQVKEPWRLRTPAVAPAKSSDPFAVRR